MVAALGGEVEGVVVTSTDLGTAIPIPGLT